MGLIAKQRRVSAIFIQKSCLQRWLHRDSEHLTTLSASTRELDQIISSPFQFCDSVFGLIYSQSTIT